MLIIGRSNCFNTASGIVLSVSGRYVYYYNPLHVSSNSVPIIRRSHCINAASGIVLSVSDRPVCRLRGKINLHTGWPLTESTIPDAVLIQCEFLMMSKLLLETCRGI